MTGPPTPGRGNARALHAYWVRGEGRQKWIHAAHPWTTLYRHLLKYLDPETAKRTASQWFHDATGHWPAERKGRNPRGRG